MDFSWYTQKTIQEVFEKLKTSSAGLSDEAVLALQKEHGFNEVEERGGGALEVLKRQFSSPFFYLLFVAGVISMLIGERVNSIVIIAFVVLNVGIGFFQEYRAQRAIYLLKKLVPQKVKVIRDNALVVIEKKYLVIGDIGSKDWSHSSYGRKIEKAVEYRDTKDTGISIVCESHWAKFL